MVEIAQIGVRRRSDRRNNVDEAIICELVSNPVVLVSLRLNSGPTVMNSSYIPLTSCVGEQSFLLCSRFLDKCEGH